MSDGPRVTPQTIAVLRVLLATPAIPRYGLEIAREAGLKSGTLHPILTRLRQAGWIEATWEQPDKHEDQGRPRRRYYSFVGDGAVVARRAIQAATTSTGTDPRPGLRPPTAVPYEPGLQQSEHARRPCPTHGSSQAGLASSGLRRAFGAVVGLGVGLIVGLASRLVAVIRDARSRFDRGRSADQRGSARPVLRLAAGLLRGEARAAWIEESEAWLLDLREAGEPWYRLLAEQLSILTRLPWLVTIHWLSARRAVDR